MAHSVGVIVKARDQASRKFGVIGASAVLMGKAFKSVSHITRATLSSAFQLAERSAIALGAGLAYSTYNAIKQQAAEIEMASALRVTNQYTEENFRKLKEQASAIQESTVYGDEYVMMLMRMALTQGVAAEKAGEVAKGAIALFEGFGGGRGKPEIFLRYYIDALRGTGSSLDSYVGELRNAKTQEEKMIILQGALAKGWDVAKSKTESAGGALKQMKNVLSDISETIAEPLLPSITSSAHAIKNWALENRDNIGWWANKTYSYVTLVKDIFWEFLKFMREDWRAGMSFVFDSFLELLKATFETAIIMAIAGGKGIWKGVKAGILGGEKTRRIEARTEQLYLEYRKHPPPGTILEGLGPPLHRTAIYYELRKQAEKEIIQEGARSIIGESINAITDSFKDAFATILKEMPEDLRNKVDEAWEKHLKRIEALGEAPGPKPYPGIPSGTPTPASLGKMLKDAISSSLKRGLPALESMYLTFAPGERFNQTEKNTAKTARNTDAIVKQHRQTMTELKKIVLGLQNLGGGTMQLEVANLK